VSLVTLGTGHALLKMLHVVTPSWSLWRSIAVWGLLACWLAGLGVVFLAVAHLASTDLVTWIAAVARIGGAMWLWDVDAGGATQVMQDGWRRMGAITVTGMPMSIVQLTLEVGLIGGAAVLLGRCLVGSRGHELWQALHTGARGVDIIATHDPVSLSMLTLGELDRVYAVSQTGSTVFDHVTYFENTPLVMPAIVSQIDEAARADAIWTNAGERLLRRGLATRRAMRPLALACGWVVFSALLVVWPWPASLIVVAALLVAASIAVSWRCRRWLRTVAAVSDAAPAVVVRAAMIREHGRSRGWALLQAMLAVPMIGGGAMTLTLGYSSGSSQALAAVQPLSGLAFLLGLAIALTAWMAGCGSRRADRVATFVLGGASLLWTQHHTNYGTFMAAIYFATAAWAAVRLMRFPDPLRAPIAA
jgi:hypothetical protein